MYISDSLYGKGKKLREGDINVRVSGITSSTGALTIPSGTTAQRDETTTGIRFNSETGKFEGWNGSNWIVLASEISGGGSDQIFVENGQVVTSDYTIPSDKNAMSTGPITISDGVTVTVPDNSRWVIL
jgi:hypothetical protein